MSKVMFLALKEIQTLVHEGSASLVLQYFIKSLTKRIFQLWLKTKLSHDLFKAKKQKNNIAPGCFVS